MFESLIFFGIVGVLFLVFGVVIPMSFRRVVSTNDVHIVQSSKETKSYGKGTGNGNTYYEWPSWIPVLGVTKITLPMSNFNVVLKNYEGFDRDRVPFVLDAIAFFRIKDSNTAAQRIASFEELESQLTSILQGAIRSILAKSNIDEIMTGRGQFGEMFTKEVSEQLDNWGVEAVKNIELMDIRDADKSSVIRNIMEKKKSFIEMESRTEVAKNMRAAEVAEIEAKREVDLGKEQARQVTSLRKIEVDRETKLSEQAALQQVKEKEKVTKEREMDVLSVEHVKTAEIKRQVEVVKAEQQKQVAILTSQGELESKKLEADALLVMKKREAEGIQFEGNAKADAEKAMQMAPVTAQITLAKEIGGNQAYQQYLVTVEKIKAQRDIGVEQAKALTSAEIKVIATGGSANSGLDSAMDMFSPKGGVALGGMLEGLAQTEVGKAVVEKVTGSKLQ